MRFVSVFRPGAPYLPILPLMRVLYLELEVRVRVRIRADAEWV